MIHQIATLTTAAALSLVGTSVFAAIDPASVTVEVGEKCGTVVATINGTPLEVYRSITVAYPDSSQINNLNWIRQTREPGVRTDTIIPSGRYVMYKVLNAGGDDYYSAPVKTEQCPSSNTTATPTAAPSTATKSATATPGVPVSTPSTSTSAPSPSATSPVVSDATAKEYAGGLASTGA